MSIRTRLRTDEQIRGPLRFALSLVLANLVVHVTFGETEAAVLGSFAVIVHSYFLDDDGDLRERAIGSLAATGVGLAAVPLGTVCNQPAALAVAVAGIVSAVFALGRTLRGYVARAAIGLQIAFFLPLMAAVTRADLPDLLTAWVVGSAVSAFVGLAWCPTDAPTPSIERWPGGRRHRPISPAPSHAASRSLPQLPRRRTPCTP